jgi:hypothetical protein
MKIILFAFGLWFVYWNCCGLSENLSAVWHFIALLFTSVSLALWVLRGAVSWLVASALG